MTDSNLLKIENLTKTFSLSKSLFGKPIGIIRALDNVSLEIRHGETVGVVGESGCGKTTLARCILRLIDASSGRIIYDKDDIRKLTKEQMRQLRRRMQVIFQDPYSSLNPRMTISDQLLLPLNNFNIADRKERYTRVTQIMDSVGLKPDHLNRYPHEFSGGQRQRIVIARALILDPEFVICDEPVAALDVSVRSQILNLMADLHQEFNLTYLFISHDLSLVRYLADRVVVMYMGEIVEQATKDNLFKNSLHPYTNALLASILEPVYNQEEIRRIKVKGEIANPVAPPSGCKFHPRCNFAMDICKKIDPKLIEVEHQHLVKCHKFDEKNGF